MESEAARRLNRKRFAGWLRPVGVALAVCAATPLILAAQAPIIRASWMPRTSLESLDGVQRAIASAAAAGANTLFVPIRIEPEAARDGSDPVAELMQEAAARGLRVHAWLDVARAAAAGELPGSRDHVIYQHPEWLMVPRDLAVELMAVDVRSPEYLGRLARWTRANAERAEGIYVSPLHGDAVRYLAERVAEMLRRYRVQGVHLDALRFPGADFDYSRRALDTFRADVRTRLGAAALARMDQIESIDPFAYVEEFPDQWRQFRQTHLTTLAMRLRAAIRSAHPDAVISAGVAPDPALALRDHLQDWRTWMDARLVDAIVGRGTRGALLFSYETLLKPPAPPVLTTSQRNDAGGIQ